MFEIWFCICHTIHKSQRVSTFAVKSSNKKRIKSIKKNNRKGRVGEEMWGKKLKLTQLKKKNRKGNPKGRLVEEMWGKKN